MFQSFLLLVVAIVALFLPVVVAQHRTDAGQKTEQACLAEWRAKGVSRAKGMTQKAFVEQCRSGHAAAQMSASSARPSTNGTASPLQKSSHPSAHLARRHLPERHSRHHARIENHASGAAPADSNGGF
jgi:hypothetical protein